MKLQLALDEMKLDAALELMEKVKDYVDIIEIGTPFCLDAGNNAVEKFEKKLIRTKKFWQTARLWTADIWKQKMRSKQELTM